MPEKCLPIALAGYLAVIASGCASGSDTESDQEPAGRATTGTAATGFDPAALDALAADIENGDFPNTHAVLIENDGALVFELYFEGSDERWGTPIGVRAMDENSLHDVRSISKSVNSLLLGIALGSDFERAVRQPLSEYLPELSLEGPQASITLHQALTMTAGLEWNEMTVPYTDPLNDEIRLSGVSDPAAYVLDRPMATLPGRTWSYNGGLAQVIATIILNLTGRPIDEYARIHLFEPLEIVDFEWLGPDTWIPRNPSAASGLRLTAPDLAKVGSMVLQGGRWRGTQIVPEEWIELSGTRFVEEIGDWSNNGMWGYGYQWWVGNLGLGTRVMAGVGNGNQRLFILPSERLVVTILAGEYNRFEGHSERILDRVLAARR